jgi:hypothetical protein
MVDLAIPGYIEHALKCFWHPHPKYTEHVPHAWQKPTYGTTTQLTPDPNHTPALDAADCQHVQEVIGILLYYAQAVDPTLLTALGTLATQQAQGMQATLEALTQLLNYCATHPDASIHCQASDMVLWAHSNASYLSAPKGQSHAASYYFLSSHPHTAPVATDPAPPNDGPVHILCQIMCQVVASTVEAELGALFLNAQAACPLCITLDELSHPQAATLLQTDNDTACGIINDMVKQKRSKAIDMQFTGYVTAHARVSVTSFGAWALPIMPIIFPNITQPNIINLCATLTCIHYMPSTITTLPCSTIDQNILVRVC